MNFLWLKVSKEALDPNMFWPRFIEGWVHVVGMVALGFILSWGMKRAVQQTEREDDER